MSGGGSARLGRALRDAGLGAMVALLLSIPLLSHLTIQEPGTLVLESRWQWVGLVLAVVFVGRLAVHLLFWSKGASERLSALVRLGEPLARHGRWLPVVLAGVAVLLPLLPFASDRIMHLATLVLIYVMLGWGLNIVVGLAGLLDLGYVAFYALGAYSYALLRTTFGWSFWICLPLAGILAALWGILLGFPVLRLRGDYLAIVTLAFGEIIRIILMNWRSLTGGPNGILDVPRPTLFGLAFKARAAKPISRFFGIRLRRHPPVIFLYYVILALALLTNCVTPAPAAAADRPGLGGLARGRDRLPRAGHQHRPTPSSRPSRSGPMFAGSPARSSPRAKALSARKLRLHRERDRAGDRRARGHG